MTNLSIYDQLPEKVELFQRYFPVFRTAMGMTADDLADVLDVTRTTIANIENGRTKMQKIYILAFMAVMQIYIDTGGNDIITFIVTSLINGATPPGIRPLTESEQRRLGEILEKARFKSGRKAGIAAGQKNVIEAYKNYISNIGSLGLKRGAEFKVPDVMSMKWKNL